MRPESRTLFEAAKLIGANTDPDVYHRTAGGERGAKDFIMSRSALADFVACPSKWKAGFESNDTTATKWGTLMDVLVLSPDSFDDRFSIYPETYPCEPTTKDPRAEKPWNNNATYCKDWKTQNAGKIFIYREKRDDDGTLDEDTKTATFAMAVKAKGRIEENRELATLIGCSQSQVMVMAEYHDRATGLIVPFKILIDLVPDLNHADFGKTLADFKTARNASEHGFKKAVHDGFYDWQATTYRDAYVAATGEDRTDFLFAVQENVPPYQPALWSIGTDWLNDARAEVKQALQFYCWCVTNDEWPGYPVSTRIASWGLLSREAWMLRDIQRIPVSKEVEKEMFSETPT